MNRRDFLKGAAAAAALGALGGFGVNELMAAAPKKVRKNGPQVTVFGISLNINGGNVHIIGANGEVMEVFNLTGTKVATIRIDSNDKTFALNLPKGCYLIKVGKIVRKISVQ